MRLRTTVTPVICLLLAAITFSTVAAEEEFRHFPEFRYTSGLPGGGFGVTPDGVPGFEGAMQLNVPVAYTPHRGVVVGYSSGSFDSEPRLDLDDLLGGEQGQNINGTGYIGLGLGKPGYGLFLVEMPTSVDWEPAQNIQQQVMPEGRKQPAVAVGIQDIFKNRDGFNRTPHEARSPYVVATKRCGSVDEPVFLTLGYGEGRFHDSLFGGASWRAAEKFTVMAEYDGFNMNAAAAYDLSDLIDDHTILYAGMVDLDRAVIGISYVYSDLEL